MILKHGKNWTRITRVIFHADTNHYILKCRETTIGIIPQQSPNGEIVKRVLDTWACIRLTYLVSSYLPA